MIIFEPVKTWLKTLTPAYRKKVAGRADLKPRFITGVITGEYPDPPVLKIERLHAVMVEDKEK